MKNQKFMDKNINYKKNKNQDKDKKNNKFRIKNLINKGHKTKKKSSKIKNLFKIK